MLGHTSDEVGLGIALQVRKIATIEGHSSNVETHLLTVCDQWTTQEYKAGTT
jgi:hypothetical protein